MQIKKIPFVFYSLALMVAIITPIVITNTQMYLNDTQSSILLIVISSIVLIGALISLIIKIKLKEKKSNALYLILFACFVIFSSLANFLPFLGNVLEQIQIMTWLLLYFLIAVLIIMFLVNYIIHLIKKKKKAI